MEKICKVVGMTFLGITFFLGVLLGIMEHSLLVLLVLLVNGFMTFVAFFALGEILEYVQIINGNILQIFRRLKNGDAKGKSYDITRIADEEEE